MIKINFVREKEKERKFRLDWFKVYIFFVFLSVLFVLSSFFWIQKEIAQRNKEKLALEKEKSRYIVLMKKLEALKKEDLELRNRIQTIIDLKKKRGHLLRVFDEVLLSVPLGRMYLVNFSLYNKKATLSGFAMNYENVDIFIKRVEKRFIFKRTDLLYNKQKKIKGYNLIEFKINLEF